MRMLDTRRLPDAYRYLLRLSRSGWAWEFLRRNPAYRAAATALSEGRDAAGGAAPWGLHFRRASGPTG